MTSALVVGRLVVGDEILPGRIEIDGARIASVTPDEGGAGGPYLCPGFVDVHVHGWGGHDAMGDEAALDGMARALLRRGVTAFLPTAVTSSMETLTAFADRVRSWLPTVSGDAAEPLGFNLEGPFISHARKGAQNPDYIVAPTAIDSLPSVMRPLLDGLRIMTIAPEAPGAVELIRWLAGRGVVVALGHSAASADDARAGYAAGARSTTHLFNAMSGVDNHAPGLAAAALATDEAYVELVADGLHVDRWLWPMIRRTKPADRLLLVSDAISLAGAGEGRTMIGGLEVEVRGEQCRLVSDGRLAGSVIALDSAVRNLAGSGVPLPAAVACASRNPLRLLGIDDRGEIAAGQRADLVELDDGLRVQRVMRAGVWHPRPKASGGGS
jgi:N-acetylglucosamine-6-phosphate deacetylase